MENINALNEFLTAITTYISQYNFDKAKDLYRKEKTLTNSALFKDLINLIPSVINVEKSYSELGFLSARSKISLRKDNTLKSAYNEIQSECEKLRSAETNCDRILSEIMILTESRSRLIDFYDKMYTVAGFNKHLKIQELVSILQSIMEELITPFAPKTLTGMKTILEIETGCVYDLLNAQFYLENWNLVLCTSYITTLKAKLTSWERIMNNKETWKLNFLRNNTAPELYRWILKFRTFMQEKFSLYFYMIIRQQVSVNDLRALCNKQYLEFVLKFQNLSKKSGHEATVIMLVFDACGFKNWHGPGYRCPLKNNKLESPSSSYYVMLRHPEKLTEVGNLMPTIRKMLVEHFSDILFLDRVVCRYFAKDNSTYFVISIEDKISLVSYYNSKKDDRQSDIDNYMLELAWMIRCHRVFLGLNQNR